MLGNLTLAVRFIMLTVGLTTFLTVPLAERLYLSCTLIEEPTVIIEDLYTVVPKTRGLFIKDVWQHGGITAAIGPPKTWVIDTVAGTIGSPEGNGDYRQTREGKSLVEGVFRSANGTIKIFLLNRVDRVLSLSIHYAPHSFDEWKNLHGKVFPLDWNWRESCKAVAPM